MTRLRGSDVHGPTEALVDARTHPYTYVRPDGTFSKRIGIAGSQPAESFPRSSSGTERLRAPVRNVHCDFRVICYGSRRSRSRKHTDTRRYSPPPGGRVAARSIRKA